MPKMTISILLNLSNKSKFDYTFLDMPLNYFHAPQPIESHIFYSSSGGVW